MFTSNAPQSQEFQPALPPRRLQETPERLLGLMAQSGHDADEELRIHAEVDWQSELSRANELREAEGLSKDGFMALVAGLRQRHLEIWRQWASAE